MAGIVLPNRFVRQPQYPVTLDPYWERRIAFASISGLHGGRDLVSKQRPVPGGTIAARPTVKGVASYTGSVADGLVWANLNPVPNTFNTGLSFLVLANPAAQAAQQRVFFLGDETAAGGSFNQASFQFNCNKTGTPTSGLFSAFEYNFGFQGTGESTAGAVDGNWHVFIATRPSGFGSFTLYRDGLNVTSSGDSANGATLNNGCRLHVNPGATIGYTGDLVLAVAFDSQLSLQQVIKLSANPWQILKSPDRKIWVAVPAASSDGVGSASGTSTVSGVGASYNAQPGTASGTSTVSGVGASTAESVASSSGTSTASGVGQAVIESVGTASGTSTADGVGTSGTGSSGSASGTSSADGVGAAVTASVGSSDGLALASGVGASVATSTGTSSGTSTVSGVGDSIQAGSAVGTASGTSTATGAGASVVAAVGSASGDCAVTGKGSSTGGIVESFSGGYLYISRESHAERKKKQRIALGIIEEEAPGTDQFEISDLVEKQAVSTPTKKQHIPARQQKKLEQEAINAELKALIQLEQLELDREEETIIRMLMEM